MGQHKLLDLPQSLVLFCYAPFPLAPVLVERLRDAGIVAWAQEQPLQAATGGPPIRLWIYDSPDRMLQQWRIQHAAPPSLSQLVEGLQSLLRKSPGSYLISGWRLEQLEPASLRGWVSDLSNTSTCPQSLSGAPPAIEPLVGQLVLSLLADNPSLLETYLDLELQGELAGTMPDSHYLQRLQNTANSSSLLASWWSIHHLSEEGRILETECNTLDTLLQNSQVRCKDALVESERSLLQLQQVQEELEQVCVRSQEQDLLLENQAQNLQVIREERDALQAECQELKANSDTLECQLTAIQLQCKASQREADLLLHQLHQVQEELETVFLRSQEQERQLEPQTHAMHILREERDVLQAECTALKEERDILAAQLTASQIQCKDSQEEAELSLLQLHQVQEELEHYFLLSREQNQLLDRMDQQQQHALQLLVQPTQRPAVRAKPGRTATSHGTQDALPDPLDALHSV